MDIQLEYRRIVDDMKRMVQMIGAFLNGAADQTVNTDAGPVMTLKGIETVARRNRHSAPVVDVVSHARATDIMGTYEDGTLFRIYNDANPAMNGLWVKRGTTLTKTSYQEIADLTSNEKCDVAHAFNLPITLEQQSAELFRIPWVEGEPYERAIELRERTTQVGNRCISLQRLVLTGWMVGTPSNPQINSLSTSIHHYPGETGGFFSQLFTASKEGEFLVVRVSYMTSIIGAGLTVKARVYSS